MFDLMRIKDAVEDAFDLEFIVRDISFKEGKELYYQKANHQVTVRLSRYTYEARLGQEFINFDYWNGTGGMGSPCDSLEELIECLDRIKMPRRTTPRQKKEQLEQLSLWQ